jgi:ABC-type iron transport system FetAB permease component
MAVIGLVSIPGMMTGQILGGSSPYDAAKYQMLIMFMIAANSTIGQQRPLTAFLSRSLTTLITLHFSPIRPLLLT